MNYIPYAAWGLCPSGTTTQIANYFGSWGLLGTLNEPIISKGGWMIGVATAILHAIWRRK